MIHVVQWTQNIIMFIWKPATQNLKLLFSDLLILLLVFEQLEAKYNTKHSQRKKKFREQLCQ